MTLYMLLKLTVVLCTSNVNTLTCYQTPTKKYSVTCSKKLGRVVIYHLLDNQYFNKCEVLVTKTKD